MLLGLMPDDRGQRNRPQYRDQNNENPGMTLLERGLLIVSQGFER